MFERHTFRVLFGCCCCFETHRHTCFLLSNRFLFSLLSHSWHTNSHTNSGIGKIFEIRYYMEFGQLCCEFGVCVKAELQPIPSIISVFSLFSFSISCGFFLLSVWLAVRVPVIHVLAGREKKVSNKKRHSREALTSMTLTCRTLSGKSV